MARTTKASKTTESTSSVPVPASAPEPVSESVVATSAPDPAPAPASKAKKVKKTKADEPVALATPAVEPAVVVAPATASSDEAVVVSGDVDVPVAEQSIEYLAKLQQITQLMSSLKSEFRLLEKKWSRDLKVAQKQSSKRKRKSGNRAPSGFVKPTRISDELASFLGKEKGSEMARTSVTRDINLYIRTNNLQDKANGRKIIPDDKLTSLLKLQKTDELTYFNLQRYMSPHFAKSVKAVVESAVSA